MEGYQNYQAIIDAIKAEYVNARNLKKTATAKKRVATNAKSFKTRKENEKTSLETKLTSVENSLESNLETSFNNLEDARFDTLKSELSKLKGKLAFIDADIIRLNDRNSQDPENIGTYPSDEPTSIESQSLTVLRNMLSVTIADAEVVITNLYEGQDYAAIKGANVPTQMSNTEQEVKKYYHNLLGTFQSLFDKTKTELDDFVISIFRVGGEVNNCRNRLIDYSGELVTLKSQLADLLNDEGTEAEINAKEQQIEDLKEIMLTKATDLKQIEVSIGSAMTTQKLVKLKRYATDLYYLTNELKNYRWYNHGFLKNHFPHPNLDIAYKSFVLYSGFFEFMNNNEFLNTFREFENGQSTEFKLLMQQILQAKEYYRTSTQFRDNAYDDTNVLYQPQQLFDCAKRNNRYNGTEYYNITKFLPNVPQKTKDFYVNYSRQLYNATSYYTSEMHKYKFYKNAIHQHIEDFDSILDQQTINISALRSVKMQYLWHQKNQKRLRDGHYEGTTEQSYLYNDTIGAWFEADAEYLSQFYTNRSKVKTFELYNSIFPEFYSDLSTLESTIDNLNISSLYTTYTDLQTSRNAAYAYLQTLTETDEEYQAAFTTWNNANTEFQSLLAAYDALTPQYELLNNNLTDATNLVNSGESEAGLIAATDALNAFQTDIRIPASNAKNAAEIVVNETYGILQPLTEIDEEYVAAFNDWNSKVDATNLFYSETVVPGENAFQSADNELNQYLSSNYGSDFDLSYGGAYLKLVKDDRDSSNTLLEQALSAKSTTEAAFIEAKNSMTFVESTPLEKRQGMREQIDVHKLHKQVERLESLANRYSEIFPIMINQAQSFVSEVSNRDESYFTFLLQHVKDFMDGDSTPLGPNLYVNKLNNYKVAEEHASKYQMRLNTILEPVLKDWNMNFDFVESSDSDQSHAIQRLTTDNGIGWIIQRISNINNELFRNVDGFSFANSIFNEVNDGRPLI